MISKFNNQFINMLKSVKNNNNYILGLSGGIDSMALLHLLKNFEENKKNPEINIKSVIVDHNLRDCSGQEAISVKNVSQSLGFHSEIKKIIGKKPSGNIQKWARIKRRDILYQLCIKYSANLILAHQSDDQAETLFMRMIKKTALDGISGMSKVKAWNGIFILRPLLVFNKKEIKNYIKNNKVKYFQDISNTNLKFERVKTRFYLDSIKKNFWPSIYCDLNNLSKININLIKKIDNIFNNWAQKNILVYEGGAIRVNFESLKIIFDKSYLFSVRIIGKIIQTVGGSDYPPKRYKTYELISSFFNVPFNNKSLGNVNVFLQKEFLYFIRENRNLNFDVKIFTNRHTIFDGRFLVLSSKPGKLIQCFDKDFNQIKDKNPFYDYNLMINKTIPHLKTLEGKTIRPHLKLINQNSVINDNLENNCFNLYLVNRILV